VTAVRRSRAARKQRFVAVALGILLAGIGLFATVLIASRPVEQPEGGVVQSRLGDDEFQAGVAERLAARIATDGQPFLIADASPARARDIYLQHTGDDPDEGWLAFAARAPDQDDRNCSLQWIPGEQQFADPCTGVRFPPDGQGLTHYATRVTDGVVHVDLRTEVEAPPEG
jgi:hypothetical protein